MADSNNKSEKRERVQFDLNGRKIWLDADFQGYKLTQEEFGILLAGGIAELPPMNVNGRKKTYALVLTERESGGKTHTAYKIIYDSTEFPSKFADGDSVEKISWKDDNGSWQSFKRVWAGHRFTPQEITALINGQTISFTYTTKKGAEAVAEGRLGIYEFNGKEYFGFINSAGR